MPVVCLEHEHSYLSQSGQQVLRVRPDGVWVLLRPLGLGDGLYRIYLLFCCVFLSRKVIASYKPVTGNPLVGGCMILAKRGRGGECVLVVKVSLRL